MNIAIDNMCRKTRDLRRQVGKDRDVQTETPCNMNLFFPIAGVFISGFCSFKITLKRKTRTINIPFQLHTSAIFATNVIYEKVWD